MSIMATELWTYVGTIVGLVAFGQTLLNAILPGEVRVMLGNMIGAFWGHLSSYTYVEIPEYDGGVASNDLYASVKLHLSKACSLSSTRRVNLSKSLNSAVLTYTAANNELICDSFGGATFYWEHQVTQRSIGASTTYLGSSWRGSMLSSGDENRSYVLRVSKKDRDSLLLPYMGHITENARRIRSSTRERLLYTNSKGLSWECRTQPWESVPFNHPSTFETLALAPEMADRVKADLDSFVAGEGFYRSAGRAWKRGYLLHGPPGTGKSSLIAAMANYLGYDVYDLELTEVPTNAELRKLLLRTTNKSIIVIEDIDCSLDLSGGRIKKKPNPKLSVLSSSEVEPSSATSSVTLSGLLNFADGLWSSCGSERIFVFTTNHVERLDPALLRPGRMDMHIPMPYCSFAAFQILARNYLGISHHHLYPEVEAAIDKKRITPAEVSEVLLRNKEEPTTAIENLLEDLQPPSTAKDMNSVDDTEDSVDDAEEEKRALEEENPFNGKSSSGCHGCQKALQLEKPQYIELITKVEEKLNNGLEEEA